MAKLDIALVTGPSQGLGLGITKALLASDYQVIGISRSNPVDTEALSRSLAERYRHISFDLSETETIPRALDFAFSNVRTEELRSVCLINNAAVIDPLASLTEVSISDVERAFAVNVTAPLILSSLFLRRVRDWVCDRRIVNISSGLAVRPMAGSGVYCVTKSALESLNRQISEEQKTSPRPVISVAFRPGVVDTGMQKTLRETSRSILPEVDYFKSAHEKKELRNPEQIAEILIREVIQGSVRNGACYTLSRNGCEEVK